jgi:succinate dehydrogenase/fumarate reductase flavoprotein subunit
VKPNWEHADTPEKGRFQRAAKQCDGHRRNRTAFKSSNSWEYTATAYWHIAPEPTQDMEFVQFHPTGMVWPDQRAGILVPKRAAKAGRATAKAAVHVRRHFDLYKEQTADLKRGLALQGDKNARRPPELLLPRSWWRGINREVKAGAEGCRRRRVSIFDQGAPSKLQAHQAQAPVCHQFNNCRS